MIQMSLMLESTNLKEKILKQLNYVPQIQRSKISLLIAALFDNEITFRTDWKKLFF